MHHRAQPTVPQPVGKTGRMTLPNGLYCIAIRPVSQGKTAFAAYSKRHAHGTASRHYFCPATSCRPWPACRPTYKGRKPIAIHSMPHSGDGLLPLHCRRFGPLARPRRGMGTRGLGVINPPQRLHLAGIYAGCPLCAAGFAACAERKREQGAWPWNLCAWASNRDNAANGIGALRPGGNVTGHANACMLKPVSLRRMCRATR